MQIHAGPGVMSRDLRATTPQRAPMLDFSHPEMQEALLAAAGAAGAEVRRGARVTEVMPGAPPRVRVEGDAGAEEWTARMVVGADGRDSRVRAWVGREVQRDPPRLFVGGVLLEGVTSPPDAVTLIQGIGRVAIFYPQRGGRVRAYAVYHRELRSERLQGPGALPEFLAEMIRAGTPSAWLAEARAVGPLATFEGADSFVAHPYGDGVALIGDAAAASDPSWGQGLALTLRDVRVLRDRLCECDDWDAAGHAYAAEHDRYYGVLRQVEAWFTELYMAGGAAADAARARALPRLAEDPTRQPDVLISGPDVALGEAERARFFGA